MRPIPFSPIPLAVCTRTHDRVRCAETLGCLLGQESLLPRYRANRDLGRVFKTEFLLSYLSEPQLRARIRRGLLKVEQLHALARDVYSGRRRAGSTLVSYTSR